MSPNIPPLSNSPFLQSKSGDDFLTLHALQGANLKKDPDEIPLDEEIDVAEIPLRPNVQRLREAGSKSSNEDRTSLEKCTLNLLNQESNSLLVHRGEKVNFKPNIDHKNKESGSDFTSNQCMHFHNFQERSESQRNQNIETIIPSALSESEKNETYPYNQNQEPKTHSYGISKISLEHVFHTPSDSGSLLKDQNVQSPLTQLAPFLTTAQEQLSSSIENPNSPREASGTYQFKTDPSEKSFSNRESVNSLKKKENQEIRCSFCVIA